MNSVIRKMHPDDGGEPGRCENPARGGPVRDLDARRPEPLPVTHSAEGTWNR